jgi:ornithine carbamoyltransferase
MRHLLELSDLGAEGLIRLLDAADRFKADRGSGRAPRPLEGKSVALVFEKASTRTRISLEVAVSELGGHPLVITSAGSQLARGEPIADTARVVSRMVHAITFRTSGEERLREMTTFATVPVLNALTDANHPMQLLADLMTIRSVRKQLTGLEYVWVGDGNNMANSWIEAAGLLGLRLTVSCPEGYDPSPTELERARRRGVDVRIERDPRVACRGADVISTDVFVSMGQEHERAQRLQTFSSYTVNQKLMEIASPEVVVLHCLPAHRGEEIDADVIDGKHSRVWDQAEARLHTAKAALVWALSGNG